MAQVALRSRVNANLIFKGLRDLKYRPKPGTGSEKAGLRVLPTQIVAKARTPAADPLADNCIEIDLAGGHPMRISGSHDPEVLARLILGCRFDPVSGQHARLAGRDISAVGPRTMVGQVTDMRKGFAALTPQAEAALQQVPFARHLVVLRGRRDDVVKVI